MKRKVVKHGPSTLIISIPSVWAKKYNIKQGDELDVDEQMSRLIIDTKKQQKFKELEIDVSKLPKKLIERFLVNIYQLGYDRVNLFYDGLKQYNIIQNKVHYLLGYEIIDRTNENCVIKNIATRMNLDFDKSLKKVFFLVNSMIENTYESYKKDDKKALKNIMHKETYINKFIYYCLRTINKKEYIGTLEEGTHVLYHLLIKIENLADSYKKLSKVLSQSDKDKEIQKLLLSIKNYYGEIHNFFYNPEKEKLHELIEIDEKILKSIKTSFRKTKTMSKLLTLTLLNNIALDMYRFPIRTLNRMKINESFMKNY